MSRDQRLRSNSNQHCERSRLVSISSSFKRETQEKNIRHPLFALMLCAHLCTSKSSKPSLAARVGIAFSSSSLRAVIRSLRIRTSGPPTSLNTKQRDAVGTDRTTCVSPSRAISFLLIMFNLFLSSNLSDWTSCPRQMWSATGKIQCAYILDSATVPFQRF